MMKSLQLRLREGWLMVGLLALMLFSVTWSVQRAGWADGLFILTPITLLGMFTGLFMAKLRGVPRVLLHLVGLLAGYIVVMWQTASLLEGPELFTIQDRVQDLFSRMGRWGATMAGGGMSDDLALFILALGMVSWLLAYGSSWFLFRSRWLWWALIPNGIALLINISYASASLTAFFVLYMFSALLLMVRFNVLQHEDRWERERVNYSPGLRWSFLWVSALVASTIAVIMFFVPPQAVNSTLSNAWGQVNGPWVELQLRWSRAFARVSGGGNFGYSAFNSSFSLGGALNLGNTITLRVKSDEPLYWRARSFDKWDGVGWTDTLDPRLAGSNTRLVDVAANQIIASDDSLRRPITVTIQVVQPKEDVLFAPSRFASSSITTKMHASWQNLVNAAYKVPGTDPQNAAIELRPLLTLLEQGRNEAITSAGGDPNNPATFSSLQLAGGTPQERARQLIAGTTQAGAIGAQVDQLSSRGISVSYGLGANLEINISASGQAPNYDDMMMLQNIGRVEKDMQYSVESLVSAADATSLRGAGTAYPAWVTERYLELPSQMPRRIVDKANEVVAAAGATNPYDKAMAIQAYLRNPDEFTYSTQIDFPPEGRDYVDYFLFDSKTGYCEYYGTAMAVLLRSLDVPTRIATGYAPGEHDDLNNEYIVRESSSHLWPEAYFPGYGWIQFEPTPSQAPISRPESQQATDVTVTPTLVLPPTRDSDPDEPTPAPTPAGSGVTSTNDGDGDGGFNWPLLGLFLLALAVIGAVVYTRTGERARLAAMNLNAAQYYERLLKLAWWIGLRPGPNKTPFEFAEDVIQEVPGSGPYVKPITEAYVRERFGRRDLSNEDRAVLMLSWQELRLRMVRRLSQVRRLLQRGD